MSGYMRMRMTPNTQFPEDYHSILFSVLRTGGQTQFYYFMSGQNAPLTDASNEYSMRIDIGLLQLRAYVNDILVYTVDMNENYSSLGFINPRVGYAFNPPTNVTSSGDIFEYFRFRVIQ